MQILDIERIPVAIVAILVSAILGFAMNATIRNANPLTWQITNLVFGWFGDRLNRAQRPRGDLVFRGFLLTAIVTIIIWLGLQAIDWIIAKWPYHGATEIFILSLTLSSGSIWALLINLYKVMDKDKAGEGAYYTLAHSARLNLASADNHTISRAAITYAADNWYRAMVAPALIYILFGLHAALFFSVFTALAWRFGKRGFSKGFGEVPIAIEWLMGIIPSVIAAFLLMIASLFTPKARKIFTFSLTPFAQGGLPVSIMAHALNISLGGAFQDLSGSAIKGDWIGPKTATAKNDHTHLRRAAYMLIIAQILLIFALCAGYLAAKGFLFPLLLDF